MARSRASVPHFLRTWSSPPQFVAITTLLPALTTICLTRCLFYTPCQEGTNQRRAGARGEAAERGGKPWIGIHLDLQHDESSTASMQSSAQLCRACAQLNIDALLKLPSVTLKHNHRGLPHLEWVKAILTNLPVFIPKPHPESDCPLCQLINKHLVTVTDSTDKTIAIYKYANFDDRIETLYLYLPSKEQAVLEITVYTEEGILHLLVSVTEKMDADQ